MILFKCKPDDGDTFYVEADSRDVYAWESADRRRHLGMIQTTPKMTDLGELAWRAAQRTKVWTGDLDDFRRCVAFAPVEQGSEPGADLLDPTRPAV
jgi:hypothetical protein